MSDPLGIIASPHSVIPATNAVDAICTLCGEYEVTTVVVGLPVNLSGTDTPSTARARELADALAGRGLTVELFDERFTSTIAERALLEAGTRREDRKRARDKVAAAVLLQSYLDGQRQEPT